MSNNLFSPALLNSWYEFLANEKPDIISVTEFLKTNLVLEPGDMFTFVELRDWAIANNFAEKVGDFSEEDIKKFVNEYFAPDEMYSEKDLEEWVTSHSKYIDRKTVIKLIEKVYESLDELNNEVQ